MQDAQAERLTLAQAAARLGVTQDTVRRRIKRGELTATKDNRGRYLVLAAPTEASGVPPSSPPMHHDDGLVAELRARIENLERRLDDAQAERGRLQDAHGADRAQWYALLEAERERVDRLLSALAERRQPERRPWPGLRAWWRRLWEGE